MNARPRLVILGSGFAAFRLLRQIRADLYEVLLISPRNHFLYTPLLPSTTVGSVEFRTIVTSIRSRAGGATYRQAHAVIVDLEKKSVSCRSVDGELSWEEPFDLLVIAVGADNNTFGAKGVTEHALFLRSLADARAIREKLVATLERASLPAISAEERSRLLHFVGVGAGPTGVRFAAELYDLLKHELRRNFPALVPHVKITLFDASKHLLGMFDQHLRDFSARHFHRAGIELRLGCQVEEVGPGWLRLKGGEEVPAGLVLWCAGFAPCALVAGLPFAKDRIGRILTDGCLRVLGQTDIYAAGDCACPQGSDHPQLAQVAEQQGKFWATCSTAVRSTERRRRSSGRIWASALTSAAAARWFPAPKASAASPDSWPISSGDPRSSLTWSARETRSWFSSTGCGPGFSGGI